MVNIEYIIEVGKDANRDELDTILREFEKNEFIDSLYRYKTGHYSFQTTHKTDLEYMASIEGIERIIKAPTYTINQDEEFGEPR